MVKAEDRDIVSPRCACYRHRAVEIHASVEERPGEIDRARMNRRNHIGPRRQVLCMKQPKGARRKNNPPREPSQNLLADLKNGHDGGIYPASSLALTIIPYASEAPLEEDIEYEPSGVYLLIRTLSRVVLVLIIRIEFEVLAQR